MSAHAGDRREPDARSRGTHRPATLAPRAAVAALLVFALLVALAATIPPHFDEVAYYLPALAAVRGESPPALHEFPFPGTPIALWVQALVWDACGRSLFAARLFSLLSWACLASLPLWRRARAGPLGRPYAYAWTIAFPFVLLAAISSKHHALVLLLLLVAVVAHVEGPRAGRSATWASIAACALAAGSSQLAGPLCLALAIDAVARRGDGAGVARRLAGPLTGLAVLAAFVLLWGGTSPRSFVDVPAFGSRESAAAASGLRWRPAQLVLGLATLGVWATPWTGVSRRGLWIAVAGLLPLVALVTSGGVLEETGSVTANGRGPICSALRHVSAAGLPLLAASLLGAFAALGAAGVVDRALRSEGGRLHALYVVTYLATMMAVPYAFESYYVLMVVPACHLLPSDDAAPRARTPWAALRWWVPAMGIAYLLVKAAQLLADR
jgi:hypothetical protein